jgi:drug/metabolite transporter (DMT)-like permease
MARSAGPLAARFSPPQDGWRVWSALGAIYLIWGSTYLAIRLMVRTMPPALGAGLRFVVAGALMLALLRARGRAVRVTGRELAGCAVVGTLLAAGGNGLVTVAERDVPSSLAALLIASVPLWIVLYRTLGGERVGGATLGGVLLGFVGVGVLLLPGGRPEHVPLGMALLIVLAAASWGLGSTLAQRLPLPSDGLTTTGWQMLVGGAVMSVGGLVAGEGGRVDLGGFTATSIAAWVYLVLVGSIVAFSCYAYLLAHAPIARVATYAYVNPVIAVLLGAAFLHEAIGGPTVAGMVLVVAAVAVIVGRAAPPARASEAPADAPAAASASAQ